MKKHKPAFAIGQVAESIFDAIPSPAFIVDDDVVVCAANNAGASLSGEFAEVEYRMKGGSLLSCINDTKDTGGCGNAPLCRHCAIRNGVNTAFREGLVSKKKYKLERRKGKETQDVYSVISVSPISINDTRYALVILEDISEVTELLRMLPICANCKKIRNDSNYWEHVESYFQAHDNIDFTHSICPDCIKMLYPDIKVDVKHKA